MRHGSLFSGIGGFDLAAEWMGWDNVFHCEWNPFGQRVLKHYWPNAKSYNDITQTDFTIHRGTIDILTGGFPCQPYSMAGKRKGKEDERHLWPEMLRAIREIAPKYIVGENVLGLVNWDGGLVFAEVQADLESEGYEVAAVVIPAAAVNAPHGRDRVWFVAYSSCNGRQKDTQSGASKDEENTKQFKCLHDSRLATDTNSGRLERAIEVRWNSEHVERKSEFGLAADAHSKRGEKRNVSGKSDRAKQLDWCNNEIKSFANTDSTSSQCRNKSTSERWQRQKKRIKSFGSTFRDWSNFPTQSPICCGDDGLPRQLDGITFSKWRNESIKAYGNAIVPNVAFEIFKVIQSIETQS